jgi:uncharacterized protein YfbU (UPF0304 family)
MVIDGGHIAMKPGTKIVESSVDFKLSILDPINTKDFDNIDTLKEYAHQLIAKELQRIRSH